LLLGGNLGDRSYYFSSAISLIREKIGVVTTTSSLYETEPWGFEHENWFLNQALLVKSLLAPEEVLRRIHDIEKNLGRERDNSRYNGRIIDIDILFVDEEIYYSNNLVIPHPRLHKRRFALLPLLEIEPTLRHPLLDMSVEEMAEFCKDTMRVSLYKSATTGKKK
jgi:2-amino-4-hydroxy-6-hydroxymethyldihydropteridine diphosphokinase